MQKKCHLSKRVLAMVLTVAMLLSALSSLMVFGASASGASTDGITTDGKIVAENYNLTDGEKALLKSGYLLGATHQYHVPNASDDLISIDTDEKVVTAKSFEETAGYLWNPVSAEVVVNNEVKETIEFVGNKASYTTTATAFSVKVKYAVEREVDVNTQELLLNAPEILKEGVDQLDAILDLNGEIMSSLDSFVFYSLQNLPVDENNPNASTKGVLQLLLEDGYKYNVMLGGMPVQASLVFKDEIRTKAEGMKYSEAAAAAELLAQLNENGGKLNLTVIAEEYAASASKVEFLIKNAERIQTEIENTYDYLYALTDDNGPLLSLLGLRGDFAVDATLRGALDTYMDTIIALAGDKTSDNGVLTVNETGLLEAYCSEDDWKTIGKQLVKDNMTADDYLALDAFVIALGDDLRGSSMVVKNPLVVDTTVIQFNMSMYDVTVKVELNVTEDALNSADSVVYDTKTVTLTLAQKATKAEILAAVEESLVEENALAAWDGVFVLGQFDRQASDLPDVLTENISYNIIYTPKTYTVTFDYADEKQLPYGYQMKLPLHSDSTKAYDYWVNDIYYAQGSEIVISQNVEITRQEGKSYTPYTVNQIVAQNFFGDSAKASAILNSGALNVELGNMAVNVRVPEVSDNLVTLKNGELKAAPYDSSYAELKWMPYSYTVVVDNASTTYLFNGSTTVTINEANYDRVDVVYRLNLTNLPSVQELLELPADLASEAKDQKAALDRLNGYYDQMSKDNLNKGILGALKGFIETSDADDAVKTKLMDAVTGVVNECFEGDTLRMYNLLTGYRKDGLAYYYQNSDRFMSEISLLGEYLSIIVSEEEALTEILGGMGEEYAKYVDKIGKLEGAMAELKASLTAPNAAINVESDALSNLTAALEMTGAIPAVSEQLMYLTSATFTKDADNKVTVIVSVQGTEVFRQTFTKGYALASNDIQTITDAIDAQIAELNISNKYYNTDYSAAIFTALIGQKVENLEKTDFAFTYQPKNFTVKIEGADDVTVNVENLTIKLPSSNSLTYRYDYIVCGNKVDAGTYTFTSQQFDEIVENGGCTIERIVVDVEEEKYLELVNGLNDAIGSDQIVFALTKKDGKYAVIMKMDASEPEAMANAIQDLATALISYPYVAFEDNAFIYDAGAGTKISFQALINTVMNSGFGSDTIIGMMNANGVINHMAMPGQVISDQEVLAVGAMLAQTELRLGDSATQLTHQLPMYITLGEVPAYMVELRNLLANQLSPYFNFVCVDGKATLNIQMPQKAYEAYLAVLLATDNVDITDVNAINEDVALGFLENVIRPLMMSDASVSSVQNTLVKFGYNIDFTGYEQAFETIRNFYKSSTLVYDELDSTYGTAINISIEKYLADMNLGDLGNMIAEKNSGINVSFGASLVNLDKDYEALYFDIGAAGITEKFGLVENVASKLDTMKGTAVVLLLSDVDDDLTFKTTTVLNLNGFTVNGNIVGQGSVRVVDSAIDEESCGTVTGTISGNVLLAGGKYDSNVAAFIPEGYEQGEDGVVANKFMTIVRDKAGNIIVRLNAGMLSTNKIPDIKTLAADILVEILLNGYSANKLYFNDYMVYELTVDDLVGLYAATDRKEALMQKVMAMVNGQDLVKILNTVLEDITDFDGLKAIVDADLANGTESPLFSYKLTTGTWGISIHYVEEDDSISADITAGQDQDRMLNIVLCGTDAEKQHVANLLGILADTTDADVSVQATAGKKDATFVFTAGLNADVKIDFSKDPKYAIMFSVIVADGIGAPANADLVAGLQAYFETGDMSALALAFNKVTFAQLVTAVENFQRTDTFAAMLNALGLSGYDTADAAELEAEIDAFAKLLGILARRVDVTGPAITMDRFLNTQTYAYTLDKDHIQKSFLLNLVAGYSASLNFELIDVFASIKLFNAPTIPEEPTIDYTALIQKIEEIAGENLVEDEYTADSWKALQDALSAAKAMVDNATAMTQQDVEDALNALTNARNNLKKKSVTPPEKPVDYSKLQEKIEELESLTSSLNPADYPADKWNAYLAALAHAKALIESGASQEEIDAALAALMAAYNALMQMPDDSTPNAPTTPDDSTSDGSDAAEAMVDYSALKAAIKKAEALNEKDYKAASWEALKAALEDAKQALVSDDQDVVDQATKALNDAIDALEEKASLVWVWITIPVVLVGGGAAGFAFVILQKKKRLSDAMPLVEYNIDDDDI